ncbi:MAG: YIP1 family protein [Anaerolineales bacterium]|nr:YIP1 family protein [Anaerolineales bacterium]
MDQMPSNMPVMDEPNKPGPAGWFQVWMKAVTKPSEQTFIEITDSPNATSKTAFLWVFIAGTISMIFQSILQAIYSATGTMPSIPIPGLEQYMPASGGGDVASTGISFVVSLCISPFVGLLSIAFFALFTAVVQWIAKMFGGVGTFEKLAYAFAAISLPFSIITSVLALFSAIPYVGACFGIISFGLSIYILVLQVLAVKGVNRFGVGPAIGALFIPGLVIFITCCCVVAGSLTLLGPAIGNVFDGINQSLAP